MGYYVDGFLSERGIREYLRVVDWKLGRAPKPRLGPAPRRGMCSAWGGYGADVALRASLGDRISASVWEHFQRGALRDSNRDFYMGLAGALPTLALVAASAGDRGLTLTRRAFTRVGGVLEAEIAAHEAGGSIEVGFAHGLAGYLLAYEIGCALLGADGSLRERAIAILRECAIAESDGRVWPVRSRQGAPSALQAVCNGGPGVCLGALAGFRYSRSALYVPLIEESIEAVAFASPEGYFCCGTLGRVEVLVEAFRTTGDAQLLATARELAGHVGPDSLEADASWQTGTGGLELARRRLEAPLAVDLPGLPLAIGPLRRSSFE